MEGIQTINALKAVVSSLPAQTTIPSGELVTLYAADGTPIAKISRDDLVKAVASVMASNSQNTFSKLLGVQANGTPMGIGASDLASVLGGQYRILTHSDDFDNCNDIGVTYVTLNTDNPANCPSVYNNIMINTKQFGSIRKVQFLFSFNEHKLFERTFGGETWGQWRSITFA